MNNETPILSKLQRQFIAGAALVAPIAPMLVLQGQIIRWKVGLLPDAAGDAYGRTANAEAAGDAVDDAVDDAATLFVLGESTVAGLGARTHDLALAGRFAHSLGKQIGRSVEWKVLGKNGVTARRAIDELVPLMPDESFDYVLLGLGGNDVMRLSSPRKWRRDMLELIGIVREKSPNATIFVSNCPMIIYAPIMPEPTKSILWRLSQMHDENIREFSRQLDKVFYFPQPVDVPLEGFFADGLHPSEQGYADWADAMVQHFIREGSL